MEPPMTEKQRAMLLNMNHHIHHPMMSPDVIRNFEENVDIQNSIPGEPIIVSTIEERDKIFKEEDLMCVVMEDPSGSATSYIFHQGKWMNIELGNGDNDDNET